MPTHLHACPPARPATRPPALLPASPLPAGLPMLPHVTARLRRALLQFQREFDRFKQGLEGERATTQEVLHGVADVGQLVGLDCRVHPLEVRAAPGW